MKRRLYLIKAWICERLYLYHEAPWYMSDSEYYILDRDGGVSFDGEYTTHWGYRYGVGFGVLGGWYVVLWSDSD